MANFPTSIIYIFNGRFPTERAHGIQIAKMCEAFSSAGISVTLIVPYRRGVVSPEPFNYYGLRTRFAIKRVWGMDPAWLWRLSKRIGYYVQTVTSCIGIGWTLLFRFQSSREAIFYTRDYPSLVLLALFGFRPVVEVHDYRLTRASHILAWAFARTRLVIVNSSGTKNATGRHYPIPASQFLVCPNGVDTREFDIDISIEEARSELDMPRGRFIIGYVGGFETVGQDKGIGCLLEAFADVSKKNKNAILYLVGGPDSMIADYKSQLRQLGIPDNAFVFTGQVNHDLVPMYLKSMDTLVIPLPNNRHAFTTSPLKLFEYMASSRPIVASDLDSIRGILNEHNSILVKPNDSKSLARGIMRVLEDETLSNLIANKARSDVENHTWQKRAENIINFINHDQKK